MVRSAPILKGPHRLRKTHRRGAGPLLMAGEHVTTQGPRVLIIEDDDSLRMSLEYTLRGEGYDVCACPDGGDLDKVVEHFRPDLAVLDVRLRTGPDGFTTARRLQAGDGLPIIMLTSADTVAER